MRITIRSSRRGRNNGSSTIARSKRCLKEPLTTVGRQRKSYDVIRGEGSPRNPLYDVDRKIENALRLDQNIHSERRQENQGNDGEWPLGTLLPAAEAYVANPPEESLFPGAWRRR